MILLVPAFAFVFGLIVGSFLNVCIVRLPKGESVVQPRSHCPRCKNMIAGYDNIPVVSYLILGGRCRHCREPISFLYPAVELLTGVAFVMSYLWWPLEPVRAVKMAVLGAALIALTITDLRERILPDKINFPLMGLGFLFALLVPVGDGTAELLLNGPLKLGLPVAALSVADALAGALIGGGLLFGLGQAWHLVKGVEAMGLGDVKMMAMVGLFFGLKLTVLTLLLGSVLGSVIGGAYILLSGKDTKYELPLGTFLGLAGLVSMFWGSRIIESYLAFFPG